MVQPKKDVRSFLQAYCGYALTGLIDEQCFLLNVGGGANGKSTFLEAIGRVMGPYSKTVGFDSVAGDGGGFANGSQATPDLARLRGARLARASEPEHGRQLKEGLIKSITGGEPIIARNLHRDFFEFTPQFKLVLSANQRLELSGVDHGIWRRMRLVPWEVTIPKDQQRRFDEVMEEFWEERSGILNWLVSGALDYLNDGLSAPISVTHATEEYRKDKDPVGNFASECLERNSESEVPARRMYEAFGAWCALNSVRPWSERAFAEVMLQKGHQKRRSKEGIRYIGVDLLTVADSCTAPHPSEDVVPI
jgi:putative DNA primase/helicase